MNKAVTKAIKLIEQFEGFSLAPYRLPGEVKYTIGYGRYGVEADTRTTEAQETAWLADRVESLESDIRRLELDLNVNQTAALISFAYNVGINALRNSTLVRRLRNRDPKASEELLRWVKGSHGKPMPGLIKRRQVEKDLFDSPVNNIKGTTNRSKMDNLTRMASHYKGLAGQKAAFQYVESRLSQATIKEALRLYRDNPTKKKSDVVLTKILTRMKQLNMKLITPKSGFRCYIVGLEGCNPDFSVNDDLPDAWNDVLCALYVDSKGNVTRSKLYRGTTEPGRHYVQNRMNKNGAAFVQIDTMHKDVWMRGSHRNQSNCLIQTGAAITVVRDGNNSHGRSKSDIVEQGWFGINFHSTSPNFNGTSVGKFSAGCAVIKSVVEFKQLMAKVYKANQTKFSYVLLDRAAIK